MIVNPQWKGTTMNLLDRVKALWRLLGTAEAIEQLNKDSASALIRIEEVSARLDALTKSQQELEVEAQGCLVKARSEIEDVRKDVIGLRKDFAAVDEMAQKKVQDIAGRINALVADVSDQVKACREGASQLEPEIKRLADTVRELNG